MKDESATASQLRTNRELRESAISETETELANNANDLLFSTKVLIAAISLNAFPPDQRKEASMQIRRINNALQKLRDILAAESHRLPESVIELWNTLEAIR